MNTTPRTGRSASARTASTWPTISAAWRFRWKPSSPVAQKAQASAQPAWDETQTMYFFSLFSYALVSAPGASQGTGMRTASILAPSRSSNRYLTKPSAAGSRSTMPRGSAVLCASMRSSSSRRTPRTDRRSGSPRCTAAARSLRPTSSATPSSPYCSGSIPHRCFTQRDLLEVESNLQPVERDKVLRVVVRGSAAVARVEQEIEVAVRLEVGKRTRHRCERSAEDLIGNEVPTVGVSIPDVQRCSEEHRRHRPQRHGHVRCQIRCAQPGGGFDEEPPSRLLAEDPDVAGGTCRGSATEQERRVVAIEDSNIPEQDAVRARARREGGGSVERKLAPSEWSRAADVQLPDVLAGSSRVRPAVENHS